MNDEFLHVPYTNEFPTDGANSRVILTTPHPIYSERPKGFCVQNT